MLRDFDHLSIWEIAHRWHNADPNLSTDTTVPLEVQDTLRLITRLQDRQELPVLKPSGIVLKSELSFVEFEKYIAFDLLTEQQIARIHSGEFEQVKSEPDYPSWDDLRESYNCAQFKYSKPHSDATVDFHHCYKGRVFNKEMLESVHLDRDSVANLCLAYEMALPDFWFSEIDKVQFQKQSQPKENSDKQDEEDEAEQPWERLQRSKVDQFWTALHPSQKSRLLCREIATYLWNINKDCSVADIIRHELIQELGRAKFYGNNRTARNWIKDLDPRPDDKRTGPPRKN